MRYDIPGVNTKFYDMTLYDPIRYLGVFLVPIVPGTAAPVRM